MSEEIINTIGESDPSGEPDDIEQVIIKHNDVKPITNKRTDAIFPSYTFKDVYAMYDGSIYINKIRRDCIVLTIKNESYELVKSVLDNDKSFSLQIIMSDDSISGTFDKSEYSIIGDIIIHNDGSISIQFGKLTDQEITINKLMHENAELLFTSLTGEEY